MIGGKKKKGKMGFWWNIPEIRVWKEEILEMGMKKRWDFSEISPNHSPKWEWIHTNYKKINGKKNQKKKKNNKGRDYEKMQFLINGDMQNNKNTLFVIVWSLFLQNNFWD